MCPGGYPIKDAENWQIGFLPGAYQGTYIDSQHTELDKLIENIRNPHATPADAAAAARPAARRSTPSIAQRRGCDAAARGAHPVVRAGLPHADRGRRRLRHRQGAASTSASCTATGVHGRQTLIARRLLERGVRFVQLWHGAGQPWDNHANIEANHRKLGQRDRPAHRRAADRPEAARHARRHAGHLGRRVRPHADRRAGGDGKPAGRDHNHYGFTVWLAGGGVKGGTAYGATDEFGFKAVENVVHVHDLHATILHLLGFDHERLTYRYAGRDFRLTDVSGRRGGGILALVRHPPSLVHPPVAGFPPVSRRRGGNSGLPQRRFPPCRTLLHRCGVYGFARSALSIWQRAAVH